MTLTDEGARSLMAAVLKRGYEDYINGNKCPPYCPMSETCEHKETDRLHCDAKEFLHSAWCASLCEEIGVDYNEYVNKTMDKCRLTKNTFKYIEGELRAYPYNSKLIDAVKDEIALETPEPQEGHSSTPGDTTLAKTIKIRNKIYSIPQLKQIENSVDAIRRIYNRSDTQNREIMEYCYWKQQYTNDGIAYKLGVHRNTILNRKRKIVYAIAVEMKYL